MAWQILVGPGDPKSEGMETDGVKSHAAREADREFLPVVIRTMLEHGRGGLNETLNQMIAELRTAPLGTEEFDSEFRRERDAVRSARNTYEGVVTGASTRLAALCLGERGLTE
jgi:hypothetical protein